jgi:hypothetical protein
MSQALKTKPPSLAEYAELIKADLDAAEQAGLPFYIAAGEKLIEVRDMYFPENLKGLWAWGERNFGRKRDQLGRYIGMAEIKQKNEERIARGRVPLPIPETTTEFDQSRGREPRGATSPYRDYHAPIEKILSRVDQEELARTAARQREELAKIRELAEQIITIGYKTLATKLHPDIKGGSAHAMKLLNAARDRLRRALQ